MNYTMKFNFIVLLLLLISRLKRLFKVSFLTRKEGVGTPSFCFLPDRIQNLPIKLSISVGQSFFFSPLFIKFEKK